MNTSTAPSLATIESLAKSYAAARADLGTRVRSFDLITRRLHARKVPGIRTALAKANDLKAQLVAAIDAAPDLFVRPRTLVLHGIKVGFQKGKGSIDWDDDERLAAAIEKRFPEQFDVLVKVTRKPLAKALSALSVSDLRKLGCEVEETGNFVVVKAEDSAVDKLLKAVLKEGLVEEATPPTTAS